MEDLKRDNVGHLQMSLAFRNQQGLLRRLQRSLLHDAASAIEQADRLGLTIQPLGFGPEIVARGSIDGVPIRIRWRGGLMGARSDARIGKRQQRLPLLISATALQAVVSGEE